MEHRQEVSKAVIQRLPRYYRNICELKAEGAQRISSRALAERMGLTASQIRQDFNCFGGFGQQGYGYNIEKLQEELGAILGLRAGRTAILLGAGNLGRALLNNFNFSASGFELLCAFDASPELIGRSFGGWLALHGLGFLGISLANPIAWGFALCYCAFMVTRMLRKEDKQAAK